MNRILILVDFTPTSDISIQQAIHLAKSNNSELILAHVIKTEKEDLIIEAQSKMKDYVQYLNGQGLDAKVEVLTGELNDAVEKGVATLKPDLVVVGTHGKVGLKQNLFGSNIHKLVRKSGSSVMVVNDKFRPVDGFKRVVVPLSAHENFDQKLEKVVKMLATGGEVVLLNIDKSLDGIPTTLQRNLELSRSLLSNKNIPHVYTERKAELPSVGYSRETLNIAEELKADLIAISTQIADVNRDSADIDKENVLLNDKGIAVFSLND